MKVLVSPGGYSTFLVREILILFILIEVTRTIFVFEVVMHNKIKPNVVIGEFAV